MKKGEAEGALEPLPTTNRLRQREELLPSHHQTTNHFLPQMSIHLPFPPSANRLFTNRHRGGRVRPREYNCWIETAGRELMAQRPKRHEGPVSIAIVASPPHARKRDLDNLLKAPLDLLVSHAVIVDDSADYLKSLSITALAARTRACS